MIIAIDGNEANVKNRVGSNRFAFEVIWGIYEILKNSKTRLLAPERSDGEQAQVKSEKFGEIKVLVFLQTTPREDMPPEEDWWRYEVFGPRRFWTWTGLVKRLYLDRPRPDVLFSPSHYGPGFSPIPFVISIMDLGFLRWPEQFTKKDYYQLKYWTQWSVRRAKKIIAISEFTKKDIINIYRIDPNKVVVAYPGWRKTQVKNEKEELKLKVKSAKYILFLGTLKPSKNIEGLIEAFEILKASSSLSARQAGKFQTLKLVIAGKKGWLYQTIFEKVKRSGLEKEVIFTGFVSDKEAEILMKGAEVFVLPSFWEGFGMPVLEAMAAGVPVVCSKVGALPEVVGKAAILVDPYSPESIAAGIKKAFDPKVRQRLIAAGHKRVKKFSWEKCAKIILKNLMEVAEDSKTRLLAPKQSDGGQAQSEK